MESLVQSSSQILPKHIPQLSINGTKYLECSRIACTRQSMIYVGQQEEVGSLTSTDSSFGWVVIKLIINLDGNAIDGTRQGMREILMHETVRNGCHRHLEGSDQGIKMATDISFEGQSHILNILDSSNSIEVQQMGDIGLKCNIPALVLPFIRLQSMDSILKTSQKRLFQDLRRFKFFFDQLIILMKYLENIQIAHRDIKPGNILLDNNLNLLLTDFGQACPLTNAEPAGNLGYIWVGTHGYNPPECVKSALTGKPYDLSKAQVFQFGVTAFEFLIQQRLFSHKDLEDDLRYKLLIENDKQGFIETLRPLFNAKDPRIFKEFEEIIISSLLYNMILPDPQARFSLEQVEKALLDNREYQDVDKL
ncbi:hypothetical protein FGO68_gene17742 [Halteria grandinella]|uniref:Protein kinase domain-containing protein n=1 Tax=Halteria grandinella TaxID=5974 RepID=A0A8J8NS81_HALGN|nr:hypothetical protein FGO68_gene17742 [Halteria grandinella]